MGPPEGLIRHWGQLFQVSSVQLICCERASSSRMRRQLVLVTILLVRKHFATVSRPHHRVMPLVSHFEYIDRRECPTMPPLKVLLPVDREIPAPI